MNWLLAIEKSEGQDVVRSLFVLLIVVICVACIYFVGRWFLAKLANATALVVWDGLFLLIGLVVALNFLLGLVGRQFINW